jgi:hypothetical protein
LTFYPPKKVARSLLRVEHFFSRNVHKGIKRRIIFKKSSPRIFLHKTISAIKNQFLSETVFCHSLTKELCTFSEAAQKCASFFSTLIRVGGIFLEDKKSKRVENVQHFKNDLTNFKAAPKSSESYQSSQKS